jgi:transcriptional regulator GlxA family with amidase domain
MNLPNRDEKTEIRLSRRIEKVGILLVPGYALMSYACAMEPLRAANLISGQPLYHWQHFSPDGAPSSASNGVQIVADDGLVRTPDLDLLLVCAGGNPAVFTDSRTFSWLRQLAHAGTIIGGVSGGPYILARAGLLEGRRCTIHWEHVPAFIEEFPGVRLTRNRYEIDGNRISCSGGIAGLEMMHQLIAADHGHVLASEVVEWFLHSDVRTGDMPQRMAIRERMAVRDPKLIKVLETMETSLEDVRSREGLASLAGISVRQLERLFKLHLGRTISEHYAEIRLRHARTLLRQTSLSVLEVAIASGFTNASHFSRSYRKRFGHSPRHEVQRHPTGQDTSIVLRTKPHPAG